jgi:hypothetical protein
MDKNFNELPDVEVQNLDEELAQKLGKGEKTQPKNFFDTKNYLDTKLKDGQTEKEVRIRILPMLENKNRPFVTIHTHNVKVPDSISPTGFKTYVCIEKTEGIDKEKYGYKCPYCEINREAYKQREAATNEVDKKRYHELMKANMTRLTYVMRVIERGKEEEGVKFWRFNHSLKGDGVWDQFNKIAKTRQEEGSEEGQNINVFSNKKENGGRDFKVTFKTAQKDPENPNRSVPPQPQVIEVGFPSDLSKDTEEAKKWVYDEKRWTDVFGIKPYEYLAIVIEQEIPWFDREKGVWVSKKKYDAEHGYKQEDKEVTKLEQEYSNFSVPTNDNSLMSEIEVIEDEEDLPF